MVNPDFTIEKFHAEFAEEQRALGIKRKTTEDLIYGISSVAKSMVNPDS